MGSRKNCCSSINYDYSFKVLLIGDSGVGKSSLLLSFISNCQQFPQNLSPTIGILSLIIFWGLCVCVWVLGCIFWSLSMGFPIAVGLFRAGLANLLCSFFANLNMLILSWSAFHLLFICFYYVLVLPFEGEFCYLYLECCLMWVRGSGPYIYWRVPRPHVDSGYL